MAERPALLGGAPVRTRPWPAWPVFDDAERAQLEDVLRSRMWCYGPYLHSGKKGSKVEELQSRFARLIGVRSATAVANGTAAIEVSLRAAGVGPGDEVIVPSYTFLATASAALQVGATPVFCDVDRDTFNMDVNHAASLVNRRTRALIPVHLAGLPADMDALMKLSRRHGLIVVEDCAQACGSRWRRQRVGAIGDFGTFSFQQSKAMTAGEGGIITTRTKRHAELVFGYYNLGRKKGRPQYEYHCTPWNYRLGEFLAAVLLAQLRRLPSQIRLRMRTARALTRELGKLEGIRPRPEDTRVTRNAHTFFPFRYDKRAFNGLPRDRFLGALRAEGIPCGPGYPMPLQEQPLFVKRSFPFKVHRDYHSQKTPVTQELCRDVVIFPLSVLMDGPAAAAEIGEAIEKIRKHADRLGC